MTALGLSLGKVAFFGLIFKVLKTLQISQGGVLKKVQIFFGDKNLLEYETQNQKY